MLNNTKICLLDDTIQICCNTVESNVKLFVFSSNTDCINYESGLSNVMQAVCQTKKVFKYILAVIQTQKYKYIDQKIQINSKILVHLFH